MAFGFWLLAFGSLVAPVTAALKRKKSQFNASTQRFEPRAKS